METLIWMGFLGVVGIVALIWATHQFYRKVMDWWRRAR